MSRSSHIRYGRVAQAFHWATAILVLAAFISGPGGPEQLVYATAGDFERQLHETLGMCVFATTFARLVWRYMDARPDPEALPSWMRIASKATQAALYFLLLAVPLSAIAGAWLAGHPLTLLAGIQLQPRVIASHDLGANVAAVHAWLGDAIVWLAGLHALAAMYHHFILGDQVFTSMLPRWLYRR